MAQDVGVRLTERVRKLHPAYFAMVMSTGIVSIAGHVVGYGEYVRWMVPLNGAMYAALWLLTALRAALHTRDFLADWSDHQRGVGFFTTVAATCVLGAQIALFSGNLALARFFWWLGLALWCACTYTIMSALTIRDRKPTLPEGIHGGWLVAVVATQAVCVLGCAVAPSFGAHKEALLFVLLVFWLFGGMLYIWMISLIFYRYVFFKFLPSDLNPPYWINMGAMAISTLAGISLVRLANGSATLEPLLPFLKGFTLWYWATATWWIPMLLSLGFWRHVVRKLPLVYDPLYWGAVFPLGMYAACTYRLQEIVSVPFLAGIARAFLVAGMVAWAAALFGLAREFASGWKARIAGLPTAPVAPVARPDRPQAT